jgi:hypothetical protein
VALAAGAVIYTPELPKPRNTQMDEFFSSDPSDPDTNQNSSSNTQSFADVDPLQVGGRLNSSASIIQTPKQSTKTPVEDTGDDFDSIAEADGWKYLGGVFEPSINFALVEINGSQRMLKEGMKLADLDAEVISVEEGRIEINRNGKREKITLAKPTGALVSVSDSTETGAQASGIIAPGQNTARDYQSARDRQTIGTDADKRRAEFRRRSLENENRLVGIDR